MIAPVPALVVGATNVNGASVVVLFKLGKLVKARAALATVNKTVTDPEA